MRAVSSEHAREVVRSAFWPLPSLCVVAAIGLGVGLVSVDHSVGATRAVFLFPGPPEGARSFLSSIIQAMITFTGLVFSLTIVVLALTSSQFSPRVLRTFLRDRTIQLALGIFLATFVYAMVILRALRGTSTHDNFVPRLAVTVSFALVLISVAMFIRYVAHIANMIRAVQVPQRLTLMLLDLETVALTEHQHEIRRWLEIVGVAGRRDPTWGTTLTIAPGPHDRAAHNAESWPEKGV